MISRRAFGGGVAAGLAGFLFPRENEISLPNEHDDLEIKIWELLHRCTLIMAKAGFWLKLTDPDPDWKQIGVICRMFDKDDIRTILTARTNRTDITLILQKLDRDQIWWDYWRSNLYRKKYYVGIWED